VSGLDLAVADNGRAVLAWERRTAQGTAIAAREFVPDRGWGPEERTAIGLPRVALPRVAIDGAGNATLVWTSFDEGQSRIGLRRLRVDAGWEPAETLAVTSAGSVLSAMNHRGDTALLWSDSNQLFMRIDRAGGRGVPEVIETAFGDTLGPVAVGLDESGGAIAVWRAHFSTVPHGSATLFARAFLPGSGWTPPVGRAGGWDVYASNLAVNAAGDALMLWQGFVAVSTAVRADRYQKGEGWRAETLEPPRLLIGPVGLDAQGNGWAVFPGSDTDAAPLPDRLMAQRLESMSGWQPPVTVSRPGDTDVREPDLAVAPRGEAVALWTAARGSKRALLASRFSAGGWEPPDLLVERNVTDCGIDRGGSGVLAPRVGLDGSGNAVAAWIEWDCSNATVWTSRRAAGAGTATVPR
jgi:hypothetical protein